MTRAWRFRAAPVAMLLVAACQDAPTAPMAVPEDGGGGLTFLMPYIDPSMLVAVSTEGDGSLIGRPSRLLVSDPEDPYPETPIDPSTLPASSIWDQRTTVGFDPGSAWAVGQHMYTGNKGRVTTTVTVSLDGVEIGRQSASRLQDTVFWIDFGLAKFIQAIARAFISQDCGLLARGDSMHEAWWEAVPGATIATFGRSEATSYSPVPARQPDCPVEPPPPTGGGGGGGGGGEGGYCWVEFWYDLDTGEIVDWEVLYCEPIGG